MIARRVVESLGLFCVLCAAACERPPASRGDHARGIEPNACTQAALAEVAALRQKGRLRRALAQLERSNAACRESPDYALARLDLLVELGRFDNARAFAAGLLADARAPAALRDAARRVPPAPSDAERAAPLVALKAADEALEAGDAARALALYDAARRQQPWHARAHEGAGLAAHALGRKELSRAHFDRAFVQLQALGNAPGELVQLEFGPWTGPVSTAARVFPEGTGRALLLERLGRWRATRSLETPNHAHYLGSGWFVQTGGGVLVLDVAGRRLLEVPGAKHVALDPSASWALASGETKLELIDVRTGKTRTTREQPQKYPSFDASGRFVLQREPGGSTGVLEVPTLKEVGRVEDEVRDQAAGVLLGVQHDPTSTKIVRLAVYDLATGRIVRERRFQPPAPAKAFAAALDGGGTHVAWTRGRDVEILDLASGRESRAQAPIPRVEAVAFEANSDTRVCVADTGEGPFFLAGRAQPSPCTPRSDPTQRPEGPTSNAFAGTARLAGAALLWEPAPTTPFGDGFLSWWHLAGPRHLRTLQYQHCRVALSALGNALALVTCPDPTDGPAKPWKIEVHLAAGTRPPILEVGYLHSITVSERGALAWSSGDEVFVARHAPGGWEATGTSRPGIDGVWSSPDGSRVVVGERNPLTKYSVSSTRDFSAVQTTFQREEMRGFASDTVIRSNPPIWLEGKGAIGEFPGSVDVSRDRGGTRLYTASGTSRYLELEGKLTGNVRDWTVSPDGKLLWVSLHPPRVAAFAMADGKLRAMYVPTGPESMLAFLPGGLVERAGPPGPRESLACRFGEVFASAEICEEQLVSGAVDRALAGDRSFIE